MEMMPNDSRYVAHQEREARLDILYDHLRTNSRDDGIVLLTNKDICRRMDRELGFPVRSRKTVWFYLQELRRRGKILTVPYDPSLNMPTLGLQHHGYKRGVIKLVHP